jgi:hypothetical protein
LRVAGGYEYLKARLPGDDPFAKLACAWGVGLVGSLVCFPIDTLKRRLMLDGAPGFHATAASAAAAVAAKAQTPATRHDASAGTVGSARGAAAYARALYRTGGVAVFYKGCFINAFKSAPAVAITFVANDALRDVFRAQRKGGR